MADGPASPHGGGGLTRPQEAAPASPPPPLTSISEGSYEPGNSSSVLFWDPSSGREEPMVIHYHLPVSWNPRNTPIIFVMHGVNRDAENYMARWCKRAESHNFALVVPEFSLDHWPTRSAYNSGNVFRREDPSKPRKRDAWSFSVIERVFDLLVGALKSSETGYYMYGHSAGAQFVHRYVAFMGAGKHKLRLRAAVAANAGWYTSTDFNVRFPYGFGGCESVFSEEDMIRYLQAPLILLLGGDDTDPNHKHLNRIQQAMAQGEHRLERGRNFYKNALDAAQARGVQLGWKIFTVHGVGHSDGKMKCAAVSHLFKPRQTTSVNSSFNEIFLEPLDLDDDENIDDDDFFSGADVSGIDTGDASGADC